MTSKALQEKDLPILRPGAGMNVKQYAKSIFPRPVKSLECVLPRYFGQKRFPNPRVDSPKCDGKAYPIESSTRYLRKVLLGLVCKE